MRLLLSIYKYLWATSNFIQDTFNLKTKSKKTPIFVDFLLIFLQKNSIAVSIATDQQIEKINY